MAYSVDFDVPVSKAGRQSLYGFSGLNRPTQAVTLYCDHDGFFGSALQLRYKELRGRPVGVVPHAGDSHNTSVIAVSREAKARGVKNVCSVREARSICPEIELVPQEPDYFRRLFAYLLAEVELVCEISAVKSIDEFVARLDESQARDPRQVMAAINTRLENLLGPSPISLSMGASSNRLLAKLACKAGKPRSTTVWHPADLPGPLLNLALTDVPGIADGMHRRFLRAGIWDMETLLRTPPKLVRKICGSLVGERIILGLLGYEVPQPPTQRGAFGHAKVLAPAQRAPETARSVGKALLIKAGRKMRREGFAAGLLSLELAQRQIGTRVSVSMPAIMDETGLMQAFSQAWSSAIRKTTEYASFIHVGVCLSDLSRIEARQMDWLYDTGVDRSGRENVTRAIDGLNLKFGKTVVSHGFYDASDNLGSKISFSAIPTAHSLL